MAKVISSSLESFLFSDLITRQLHHPEASFSHLSLSTQLVSARTLNHCAVPSHLAYLIGFVLHCLFCGLELLSLR